MNLNLSEATLELLDKALSGEHTEFQFIRNYQDYLSLQDARRQMYKTTNRLNRNANRAFKNYCYSVAEGDPKISNLLRCKATYQLTKFYKKEADILGDMIYEYSRYLSNGHLREACSGVNRSGNTLIDYREVDT